MKKVKIEFKRWYNDEEHCAIYDVEGEERVVCPPEARLNAGNRRYFDEIAKHFFAIEYNTKTEIEQDKNENIYK